MALSKVIVAKDQPFSDRDFDALPEHEESTAEEIHALIEKKKRISSPFQSMQNVEALMCELQE